MLALRDLVFNVYLDGAKNGNNEVKEILYDYRFREELFNLTSTLLSTFKVINVYDLAKLRVMLERYSYKLRRLNFIYAYLENLPADDYKQYWLNKYYKLVDGLVRNRQVFIDVIEARDGKNSIMEFYYDTFIKLISYLIANIRRYKVRVGTLAMNDSILKSLVYTTNVMTLILSYPIVTYEMGRKVDYDVLTSVVTSLDSLK